jgi:hypothetical protein
VVAERFASNRGLGYLLAFSGGTLDTTWVFTGLLILMGLGGLIQQLVAGIERRTPRLIARLRASRTRLDAPIVQAAVEAARATLGQEPLLYPMAGGAGPWEVLVGELGLPMVSDPGVRYAGSNDHAADEHIRLDHYFEGIAYMADLFTRFAGWPRPAPS